jgi:hypothetical protein
MVKSVRDADHETRPKAADSDVVFRLTIDDALLTAIDTWRTGKDDISRPDAVRRLVRLGLDADRVSKPAPKAQRTSRALELAAKQIDKLIDPAAPPEERDRRLSRLVKGPPEFVDARVDLPSRRRRSGDTE